MATVPTKHSVEASEMAKVVLAKLSFIWISPFVFGSEDLANVSSNILRQIEFKQIQGA